MILADAPRQDIFAAMVDAVAEDTGRLARHSPDRETGRRRVRGEGSRRAREAPRIRRRSDAVDDERRCQSLRRARTLGRRGIIVEPRATSRRPGRASCPRYLTGAAGSVLIVGIGRRAPLAGFFTIGFFDGAPDPRIASILKLFSDRVLLVLQRDRYKELLREKERALAVCKEELDERQSAQVELPLGRLARAPDAAHLGQGVHGNAPR